MRFLWIRAIQWSEAERDKTIDVAKLVSRKAERDHLKQQLAELNRMPREALRREAAKQRQAMLMAHRSPKELVVLAAINGIAGMSYCDEITITTTVAGLL